MFQHFPIFLVNPCDFDAVWNLIGVAMTEYMGINRSLLPQNNGNLPFPFFVVIALLLSWIIFINDCICILTGSTEFFS